MTSLVLNRVGDISQLRVEVENKQIIGINMSDCRHCARKKVKDGVLKYCDLCFLDGKPYPTNEFVSIAQAFSRSDRTMIPNGECFWPDDEMDDCPLFE